MIDAAQVVATLALLPGFVALKAFYLVGLRTKRSDAEWAIWSVVASVPIGFLAALLTQTGLDSVVTAKAPVFPFLAAALTLALALGIGAAFVWARLVRRVPWLRQQAAVRAWDSVLGQPRWVQVWTTGDTVISGRIREIANSVDTDDLDLYLDLPAWVDTSTAEVTEMTGVEGVPLGRQNIVLVQVYAPT